MLVCGVDVGTLKTLSYVAWLRDREFRLDLYVPSAKCPLPGSPEGLGEPRFIAFDAPQGLPEGDKKVREADAAANTPVRVMPGSRAELKTWKIYRGLIEAGVEIFWHTYEKQVARIWGLEAADSTPTVIVETYPRYVIKRLWPRLAIPSKRKAPLDYVDAIWGRIRERGYSCPAVERAAVDHIDAMLCAIVGEACLDSEQNPPGTVGTAPFADEAGRVLREGWIVSP